ncbi:hypothetical protein M513_02040 [Trichuris suis]|uniref:Uncharacterized protein n=1 Tax=Trichuris suis TaxID=68888 RepID=A0A085MIV9_9BILA|nr:hypothetical protein M513_02040 [Trichuris suis]
MRITGLEARSSLQYPILMDPFTQTKFRFLNGGSQAQRLLTTMPVQLTGVGFEPTPTEVDCGLNAAPWTARPSSLTFLLSVFQCSTEY